MYNQVEIKYGTNKVTVHFLDNTISEFWGTDIVENFNSAIECAREKNREFIFFGDSVFHYLADHPEIVIDEYGRFKRRN